MLHMPHRPFRFAVQAVRARSAEEWRTFARRTEDLGYSTLFLADHYLGKGPALQRAPQPLQYVAPIAAMATAAAVTGTLRVGCRVFCVDYHVPAVLMKEAATIDLLSDGRFEFGIGAGWNAVEYDAMGLTFGAPPDRVDKLEEVVSLFRAQCSGEPMAIEGRHVTATGYAGLPLPAQRPHPPIMIGGTRKRVLTFAAREADIVSLNNVDFVPVNDNGLTPHEEALRRLGFVQAAAGDRLARLDLESSPFFTRITDDADGAAREVAGRLGIEPQLLRDHPNALFGSAESVADLLLERRETYGINYVTVQQSELEQFAPVVDRLAGK
jgi:probable F420-dependent oxidoreductase